jgi:hypothetical protein
VPVNDPYGLLAEFDSADALVAAARRASEAGYTRVEAFSPYPLREAANALGYRRSGVPFLTFLGGLVGGSAGFFMLYWINVFDYPLNVGGRPPNSWPMWIPITFELTVLTAGLSAFLGLFVLCGLPRFHHPLFGSPLFARATTDGFYLCVEASDPKFDPVATRSFLEGLDPAGIEEVLE